MSRNTAVIGTLVIVSVALIAFGVFQLAAGPSTAPQAQSGPTPSIAEVKRISPQEINTRLRGANPPQVWEIRSAESYALQHIPGSRLVQMVDIPALAQGLDRKQTIITLCA